MKTLYSAWLLTSLIGPSLCTTAQSWGYTFPVSFGVGVGCAPLNDGGVFMYSSTTGHFVNFEADGSIANSGAFTGIGELATMTEQPNGDLISVSYTPDPGGQPSISFPFIARHAPNGTMLWGISYPEDSVWIFRPTQVVNASDGRFYVNFTGRNFHRLGYFESNGELVWMQQFDGPGFPVQLALDASGRLHGFNGAMETRFNADGSVEWETYHQAGGQAVEIMDVLPVDDGFVFTFRYHPNGPQEEYVVPGIGTMDGDGTILNGMLFENLSGNVWLTMAVATTSTGYMMTVVDYSSPQDHTIILTCDADLGNALGYEVPFPSPQLRYAIARPGGGLLIAGASGDLFTSDRFLYKLPASGEVGGCFTPITFNTSALAADEPFDTPFPTVESTPQLAPGSATYPVATYTLDLQALCIGLSVEEEYTADIIAYPNPSNGRITVDLSGVKTPYALTVIDPLGRIAFERSGITDRQLSLSQGLRPGLNHIRIIDQAGLRRTVPLIVE